MRVLLQNTKDRFTAVGGPEHAEARKEVARFFESDDMKARTSRSKVKIEVFDVASKVVRAPNKLKRERGVDVQAHRAGLVRFGDLRNKTVHTCAVAW
jgi:hypothetical protein